MNQYRRAAQPDTRRAPRTSTASPFPGPYGTCQGMGTQIPLDQLSPEVLRNLVEEFVTRDGTDYGAVERGVIEKIDSVLRQLRSGEARILFDPETETTNIVATRELPE